jgi:hypothetical protein
MMPRMPLILAEEEHGTGSALIWSIVLIAILLVLFGAIGLYRKWMKADDDTTHGGFTLSDLRRLHKEGKMSDVEFESAKAILIGSMKAAAAKSAAVPPPAGGAQGPRTGGAGFDVLPPEK